MIGLKNARKQRNLNQQKVAMDLNISREALSYYENGKREPSLSLLLAMSQYFNVSINYIITGEECVLKLLSAVEKTGDFADEEIWKSAAIETDMKLTEQEILEWYKNG